MLLKTVFKIEFVSIIPGSDSTDIKGKIDATPIISSNAIIRIINNNNPARFNSLGVSIGNNDN